MESSSQDRNLPASERKLKKARDQGQVMRSRDLAHLAVLGMGALSLMFLAPAMFGQLKLQLSRQLLFNAATLTHTDSMLTRMQDMAFAGLIGCAVFAALVSLTVVLATVSAGGWVASLTPIFPDFTRINPLSGFGRLFTKDKFAEVLKMSFITAVLIMLGSAYLSSTLHSVAALALQPSSMALQHLLEWLQGGMGLLLLVILVVAMVDVPLQNYLHKARLKMSQQEMKQEHKESEGNPEVKGKQRQRQRDIAHGNSVRAVPKADFVLMNPTHFAVAVRYDDQSMRAPQVISKGADLLALRIRDLAKKHEIPVLQAPTLARALYAHAELNADIPSSLYTAVAQVLAYIYRLRAALRGEGPMPTQVPQPYIPPELDPMSAQAMRGATP